MKHELLATLLVFGLFSLPNQLHASCCSAAATGGVPRLLAHERALIELSSQARYRFGAADEHAQFRFGTARHLPHLVFDQEMQVAVRIVDFFEPFFRLPLRTQKSQIRTGGGLADVSFGARIPVLKQDFFRYWPALSFTLAVSAPTGAALKNYPRLNNEDATSMGTWLISSAIILEKDIAKTSFALTYVFSFEDTYFKSHLHPGTSHALSLAAARSIHEQGLLSLTLSALFHTQSSVSGVAVADTDRRKLSLAASYLLSLHSHVKINTQAGFDVTTSWLTKNHNGEMFIKLGMRLGIF